ncbi:MAG TPA: sigma-70 family RNA polymerase sigma factor [Myxococcales bacterium]|nr:sigma-70 family RNA polymerase sigma factor [Myxococcales bacterium]
MSVSALYRQYGPVIYWRCLKLLGDAAAAEDATQETFLRVHRHLEKTPEADEALRWIWRIATNRCLNELRDRRRRPEPEETLPELPAEASLEDALADRELVKRIIDRVGAKLRAVAWVHYVDGLDHVEAGRMLGISRRTVANRLADFNEKARKILGRLT